MQNKMVVKFFHNSKILHFLGVKSEIYLYGRPMAETRLEIRALAPLWIPAPPVFPHYWKNLIPSKVANLFRNRMSILCVIFGAANGSNSVGLGLAQVYYKLGWSWTWITYSIISFEIIIRTLYFMPMKVLYHMGHMIWPIIRIHDRGIWF